MAKYNYNLREPNSSGPTAIHLLIRYNNQRVVYPIGDSVLPKYWNSTTQRVKETKEFPEYPEFNARLENLLTIANNVFRKYQNDHGQGFPPTAKLRKLLSNSINMVPKERADLFTFIDTFIEQSRGKKTAKTLQWHKLTLKRLKEFAAIKKIRVDFDTINLEFYYDFCDYLTVNLNHATNTVGKHIQNLKAFLNEATDRGINTNLAYKVKRFKKVSEQSDKIYLNKAELEEMYALDLSKKPRLDRVRDLFIVGCWTGLRFSDFSNIQPENIQGDFIEIETEKTNETVVIPIHWTIKEIMKKYEGKYPNSLPPRISNGKMNSYIKEVGKRCTKHLHTKVSASITKGGTRRTVTQEKYKAISSHTCRRSFASNLYLDGVPSITIMQITGHKTEKSFLTYIKVTPVQHAKILQLHWQRTQGLKAV